MVAPHRGVLWSSRTDVTASLYLLFHPQVPNISILSVWLQFLLSAWRIYTRRHDGGPSVSACF